MPIQTLGCASDLYGQGGGNKNGFADDSADAEWLIYEFLIKYFKLTERQSRQAIVSLIDAGENLVELAQGIDNSDEAAIGLIEQYVSY
jgi:hypothetical protein